MSTPEEAQKAIAALHGASVGGRCPHGQYRSAREERRRRRRSVANTAAAAAAVGIALILR